MRMLQTHASASHGTTMLEMTALKIWFYRPLDIGVSTAARMSDHKELLSEGCCFKIAREPFPYGSLEFNSFSEFAGSCQPISNSLDFLLEVLSRKKQEKF